MILETLERIFIMDYSNNRCGCMQRPHLPEPPAGNAENSRPCSMQHSMQPDIPYQPLSSGNVNTGSGFNTTGRNNRPSCPLDQSNESRQVTAPNAERECLRNMPVAMAYTPIQRWNQVYDKERGLTRGTIFPELDLPFVMGRCR